MIIGLNHALCKLHKKSRENALKFYGGGGGTPYSADAWMDTS